MNLLDSVFHRLLLLVSAVLIAVPGLRLLFGTADYVDGKDNLALSPDLYNELRAMGSLFAASAVVLLVGAAMQRSRAAATVVGVLAFLPQGVARLISYAVDEGQHDSYLRAGVIETVVGVVFVILLTQYLTDR